MESGARLMQPPTRSEVFTWEPCATRPHSRPTGKKAPRETAANTHNTSMDLESDQGPRMRTRTPSFSSRRRVWFALLGALALCIAGCVATTAFSLTYLSRENGVVLSRRYRPQLELNGETNSTRLASEASSTQSNREADLMHQDWEVDAMRLDSDANSMGSATAADLSSTGGDESSASRNTPAGLAGSTDGTSSTHSTNEAGSARLDIKAFSPNRDADGSLALSDFYLDSMRSAGAENHSHSDSGVDVTGSDKEAGLTRLAREAVSEAGFNGSVGEVHSTRSDGEASQAHPGGQPYLEYEAGSEPGYKRSGGESSRKHPDSQPYSIQSGPGASSTPSGSVQPDSEAQATSSIQEPSRVQSDSEASSIYSGSEAEDSMRSEIEANSTQTDIMASVGLASKRFAYIFYVTSNEYACAALQLIDGLISRVGMDTSRIDLVVLHGETVADVFLRRAREKLNVKTILVELLHADTSEPTWETSLTKLRAFQDWGYDRVVCLDADAVVMQNLDHLFDLPPALLYAPTAYWLPQPFFASTLMVIEQSDDVFEDILAWARARGATAGYDMDILNAYFADSVHHLPGEYTVLNSDFRRASDAPDKLFNTTVELKANTKVIHFSCTPDGSYGKPWSWPRNELSLLDNAGYDPLFRELFVQYWQDEDRLCGW